MLDNILSGVQKPGRYIGSEWNVSKKDFDKADIKFALCFPDLYEIGMSNLGLRIIYGILNKLTGVCCERFFSPGLDLEDNLRKNKTAIFSLESQKPLREFDIAGFSLGYELGYTNVLNILDLGGIPLKAVQRDGRHPLIIGGGPCTLNPEPVHDFFDLFIIGEAEEAIVEFIAVYQKIKHELKNSQISKFEALAMFSTIEGVYAPSLYEVGYDSSGRIEEFKPKTIDAPKSLKKRIVGDFDGAYFPLCWLVPFIQTVHDRITVELMRGCPNRCRFCQARVQYFPFRQRNAETAFKIIQETYKRTGYEEIALGGLSVSDYRGIENLLKILIDRFRNSGVSVSLPSIKPKAFLGDLSALIATIKKTGLTFAPESATERLRKILNKDFDTGDFFKAVEQSFTAGYQHVKLYFMIGLPFEEDNDLAAIIDFSAQVSELRRKMKQYPAWVNISVNTLIPKPHTAFQWFKMSDLDAIAYKQGYLKKLAVSKRRLKLSFHNRHMAFLEGVFSRGDRRLSDVILSAFRAGARFDGWDEHFRFENWLSAFEECNLSPDFYLREIPVSARLPWDFVDTAVGKDYLLEEYNKVFAIK